MLAETHNYTQIVKNMLSRTNESIDLKNVWESCAFADHIVDGKLELHKFAVELHSFLDGTADLVYKDPRTFFDNTYLTDQMKNILKNVLLCLDRTDGMPFTVIDTGFGGGKTHTLLLLHHIFNTPAVGLEYIRKYDLDTECGITNIPKAIVISIDCRQMKKNTLWGEIAYRMNHYELFRQYDENKSPVRLEDLKILFKEPTLLMIDELPHYLLESAHQKLGNITLSTLTMTFLMNLISVFVTSKNNSLVLTLTSTQQLYADYVKEVKDKIKKMDDYMAAEISSDLRDAISRQSNVIVPVSKDQIYHVVRTRLVKKVHDIDAKNTTVQAYIDYYDNRGIPYDTNYKDKMLASYPFHPFLIDTLYIRTGTVPAFNQTRGMLRFLGMIMHNMYKNRNTTTCTMIGTPQIALSDGSILDELTSKLNQNLRHVIESDCVTHAQIADAHRNVKIVESIARTILLYSIHSETKKSGIKRSDIRLAVCSPGMDPDLVDQAIDEDIENTFWYIQSKGQEEYYFVEQPNVIAIISEHKKDAKLADIEEIINKELNDTLEQYKIRTCHMG